MAANPLGQPERASGRRLHALALDLLEQRHVDVAVVFLPGLVLLRSQRSYKPQAARLVGEYPNDSRPPSDLLVESLEHVGRFHVPVVGLRPAKSMSTSPRCSPRSTPPAWRSGPASARSTP